MNEVFMQWFNDFSYNVTHSTDEGVFQNGSVVCVDQLSKSTTLHGTNDKCSIAFILCHKRLHKQFIAKLSQFSVCHLSSLSELDNSY